LDLIKKIELNLIKKIKLDLIKTIKFFFYFMTIFKKNIFD